MVHAGKTRHVCDARNTGGREARVTAITTHERQKPGLSQFQSPFPLRGHLREPPIGLAIAAAIRPCLFDMVDIDQKSTLTPWYRPTGLDTDSLNGLSTAARKKKKDKNKIKPKKKEN